METYIKRHVKAIFLKEYDWFDKSWYLDQVNVRRY
jgi:hypothetical protein